MAELSEGLTLDNRFRLIARLGSGGMGQVWLAADMQTDEQIALKILDAGLATTQGFVDLLEAECDKARRLMHPNIVRVYAAHHADGYHFISMQYVEGRSLAELRGRHWREIVESVLPLTDALEFAHKSGLVHRDVKPANVLLDSSGNPHLMDFGVASMLSDEQDKQIRTGGSLPAMSPQQAAGDLPGVSDDVYSFGALLYDLISGAPLFDPDETTPRAEQIVRLSATAGGADIPQQLDQLVAALLDENPGRRPAGMRAVRAVLDELLADIPADAGELSPDGAIRPVTRRKVTAPTGPGDFKPQPLTGAGRSGVPGRPILIGAGVLAVLLLVVVFLLPAVVENNLENEAAERAASVDLEVPAEESPGKAEEVRESQGSRELADSALADLLQLGDRLRKLGIDVWGGIEWAAVRNLVSEGDEAYKDRRYDIAAEVYRRALVRMQPLEARALEVLTTALADGRQAINDGNAALALERFDLALLIEADNADALAGRERALQLDKVLALVAQASQFELLSEWPQALAAYEAALELDELWEPAQQGRDRVQATIAGDEYQVAMSAGYAALSAAEYSAARRAFERALRAKPGDTGAQGALRQLDSDERLARILRISEEAESFRAAEKWRDAQASYEAVLQIDPNVITARDGLALSRKRGDLDDSLRTAIASPDRLSDDTVWQATGKLLDYARRIDPAGPVLDQQRTELDRLLKRAKIPVAVQFESDNLTEVVIYKVGKLGLFQQRTIELKPGSYTVIGVRSGYRDVRRQFRVAPETGPQSIVIRCEDPI